MDVVSVSKNTFNTKTQITASDIPCILDQYEGHISALSLDCFDTLLWRKTAAPKDVFYDMQHREAVSILGVTAYQRMAAAARAYRSKLIKIIISKSFYKTFRKSIAYWGSRNCRSRYAKKTGLILRWDDSH